MKKMIFGLSFLVLSGLFVFADDNYTTIQQIIKDCKEETGVSITITGTGRRSVRHQAELMANMTGSQLNWYGSSTWYVVEMKDCVLTGTARVNEFERLITEALKKGSFVSRHLKGDAVDIAPSTSKVRNYLTSHGVSIKDETVDGNNCWHLELE